MLTKEEYINQAVTGHGPQHALIKKLSRPVFFDLVEKYFHKEGDLIDIGCGTKPHEEILKGRVKSHIGFDHESCLHNKDKIDVFGDIYNMPFEDNSFDFAISNSVLEHLEEPQQAVNEAYRILKDEGIAIYSAPLFFYEHEAPRDFYRFTEHGLRYIFEKAGFEVLEIIPLSGFWATFGTFLSYNILWDTRFKHLGKFKNTIIKLILNKAEKMENVYKDTRWTWAYYIVAQKKENKE